MPDVTVVVNAINKTKGEFAQINRDLELLQKNAKANAKDYEQLSRMARGAGIALLGVGVAGGAIIKSSTELAARVETLGTVMYGAGRNSGYTVEQLDRYEAQIKSAGITTQITRQSILQLMQANINLAEGADLARVAQNAAVVAGINSSEAFNRLVTAIQRGDTEMLRTMGILVDFQGAYQRLADETDTTTKKLSMQEKTQARLNEVYKVSGVVSQAYTDAMHTAGKQIASTDRLIEELQLTIGNEFLPIYTDMVGTLYDSLKAWNEQPEAIKRTHVQTGSLGIALAGVSGAGLVVVSMIPSLIAGFQALGITASMAFGPIGLLVAGLTAVGVAAYTQKRKIENAREEQAELTEEMMRSDIPYKQYIRNMEEYAEKTGVGIRKTIEWTDTAYGQERQMKITTGALELMTEEMYETVSAAASSDQAMLQWASQGFRVIGEGLRGFKKDTKEAKEELIHFKDEIDKGFRKTLEETKEEAELAAYGYDNVTEALQNMIDEYTPTLDTLEEFNDMVNRGGTELILLEQGAGQLQMWDARRALVDLGVDAKDAWTMTQLVDQWLRNINGFNGSFTLTGFINYVMGGMTGPGLQNLQQDMTTGGGGTVTGSTPQQTWDNTSLDPGDFAEGYAEGGILGGDTALVGEAGQELIVKGPQGFVVIPNPVTQWLLRAGVVPGRRMQWGGEDDYPTIGSGTPFLQDYAPITEADFAQSMPGYASGPVPSYTSPTGSGGVTTEPAAETITHAVEESAIVITEAVEEMAVQVPGAVGIAVAQQMTALKTQMTETIEVGREQIDRLDQILEAIEQQGTSDDTAEALSVGLQKVGVIG